MPVFTIQLHNNMSSTTLQLLDNMSSTTLQLYNSTTIWAPQFHNSTTIWAPQLETQAAPQQYELRTVVSTRPSVVNSLAALVIIFTALATCVFVKVIAAIIVINIKCNYLYRSCSWLKRVAHSQDDRSWQALGERKKTLFLSILPKLHKNIVFVRITKIA